MDRIQEHAPATMVSQQNRLPSMPVPPLKQTCEIYLSLLEPLVEADELMHSKQLVGEFLKPGGVGERLQKGLERRACINDTWLSDDYLKLDFLDHRKPVVVHSNAGSVYAKMEFKDKKDQIRFAAEFTRAFLYVNAMVENGTLPTEHMRGKPLCMKQYEQVFSSCRIPGPETDTMVFHSRSTTPPKHITVAHNCQFFVLNVHNSDGTLMAVDQLCVQLERICNASPQPATEPVGILTTQHREIWSKTYSNLIKDETNRESLSAIESSILTLCLDRALPTVSEDLHQSRAVVHILHGGGSQFNSGNRWFDKGLQIIVGEDGTTGANGSHAAADGTVFNGIGDHVVAFMRKPQMQGPMEPLPIPQKLHFNITPEIKKDIEEAKQHIDTLARSLDMRVKMFEHFGKNVIKAAKLSPDAFLQMALQLAYYRIYQQCCATYEPASLRMFKGGRLGAIQTTSSASAAFVKSFDDPEKQASEKFELMEKAIKAHRWYSNMVVSGQFTEEHLLALKIQAVEANIPMPEIFTDSSFTKAFDYQISTSQVASMTGNTPCVGPEKPGIFSVMYSVMKDHINLIVSRCETSTCKESNALRLIQGFERALLDMRALVDKTAKAKL